MVNMIVLVGIPGCGKSTFADILCRNGNVIRLSSDEIRKELFGDESFQGNNNKVFNTLYERAELLLKANISVVIDATNLKKSLRRYAFDVCPAGVKKIALYYTPDVELCKERNATRERKVPDEVIERMARQFEIPTTAEGFDEVMCLNGDEMV